MPLSSPQSPEPLLTVPEVADLLRLKPKTVYEWVGKGRLPCFRLGGRIRFSRSEVLRWLAAQKEN